MDRVADRADARKSPTREFWVCILASPIGALAAASSGAMLYGDTGFYVALSLLALILAAFLAHDPAVRLMPAARGAVWVLAGVAISVAVVVATTVLLALLLSLAAE